MNKKDLKIVGILVVVVALVAGMLWVAQFLSKQPKTDEELEGYWKVYWESVNLREGPDSDAPIIGQLEKGDVVRANGRYVDPFFATYPYTGNGANIHHFWGWVTTEDGVKGYLDFGALERCDMQEFHQELKEKDMLEFDQELKGEWTIQWKKVNLRKAPDINAEVAKVLERGATVEATGYYVDPPYDIPVGGDLPDPNNVWAEVECGGETYYMVSTAIRIPR